MTTSRPHAEDLYERYIRGHPNESPPRTRQEFTDRVEKQYEQDEREAIQNEPPAV
jgi:hypothetical protein